MKIREIIYKIRLQKNFFYYNLHMIYPEILRFPSRIPPPVRTISISLFFKQF